MRPSTKCIFSVLLLIAWSIALPDAARSAAISISYHQVGICKGYERQPGPVTTRSDEAFAIFKIEAVDNTKPSGRFDFDPRHLYVDQSTPEQKAKPAVWDKNCRFLYPDRRLRRTWAFQMLWKPLSRREQNVRSMALRCSAWHKQPGWRAGSQSVLFRPRV